MRAAYALARLNAKAQHFEVVPSSYNQLSDADVAAALGCVKSEGARALLRVKWAQQDQDMPILLRCIAAEALDALTRYGCSAPDPYTLTTVLRVAIRETTAPRVCKTCSGTGVVYQLKATETNSTQMQLDRTNCWACEGHGHRAYSERTRARAAGLSKDSWRRHWAGVYADVLLPIVDRFEQVGLRAVNRRLQR